MVVRTLSPTLWYKHMYFSVSFWDINYNIRVCGPGIGLPSLVNQRLAIMIYTVSRAINSDHAPRSIKELIGHRNSCYDLRGNDILKLPKANTTTYGLKSWRFKEPELWNSIPRTLLELFGL